MNVFIDCGYFYGAGFDLFKKTVDYKDDFVVYAFDPSVNHESKKDFHFYKKAAYIYDGEIDFHTSSKWHGRANGIFKNPKAIREKIITVPCIDLSKWIMDNFSENDFIVLKMDIEGAENDVIKKMIDDGSINYIRIAYIEPHNKNALYAQNKNRMLGIKNLQYRSAIEWVCKEYLRSEFLENIKK